MMVCGRTVSSMGRGITSAPRWSIKAGGNRTNCMGMEWQCGKTVVNTRVTMSMAKSKERGGTSTRMARRTLANGYQASSMDTARCTIQTARSSVADGSMASRIIHQRLIDHLNLNLNIDIVNFLMHLMNFHIYFLT